MNKRQMGKMMRGAFTLSALSLSAADLTLVGDGTAVWNRSTVNWKDANGQETRYADGDNVMIGGEDFTGVAVTLGAEWLGRARRVRSNGETFVCGRIRGRKGKDLRKLVRSPRGVRSLAYLVLLENRPNLHGEPNV